VKFVRFILGMLLVSLLGAEDFSYKFDLSATRLYVKEPLVLKLNIEQTDKSKVLLFRFDLKKSDAYEFHRIDMRSYGAHHAARLEYTYLVYPLRAGRIDLEFDLTKMVTTDESVAYSFSGDRDNVRDLHKDEYPISLPPLGLDVQAIPEGTDLVGDFSLSYDIPAKKFGSYEPIPIKVTLEGNGYPPLLEKLYPESKEYRVFEGEREEKMLRSVKGTANTVIYPLALSAEKSFTLPPLTLNVFDPKRGKSYTLTIGKHSFEIEKPDIATLVDSRDDPKPLESDSGYWGTIFSYLIVFAAGYLSAVAMANRLPKRIIPQSAEDETERRISETKDPKKLLALLMATDRVRYKDEIEKLEKKLFK